jgi:hypothetical protein
VGDAPAASKEHRGTPSGSGTERGTAPPAQQEGRGGGPGQARSRGLWRSVLELDQDGDGRVDFELLGTTPSESVVGVVFGASRPTPVVLRFRRDAASQGEPARVARRRANNCPVGACAKGLGRVGHDGLDGLASARRPDSQCQNCMRSFATSTRPV